MTGVRRSPRAAQSITLAGVLVLGLVGCREIGAPPGPTTTRLPTNAGVVAQVGADGLVELEDGSTVMTAAAADGSLPVRMSEWTTSPTSGGLIVYGEDASGRFFAVTPPPVKGCFELHAAGRLERDGVHLAGGMVLRLARDAPIHSGRSADQADPSWLFAYDIVCLDRTGLVTSVEQLPFGA